MGGNVLSPYAPVSKNTPEVTTKFVKLISGQRAGLPSPGGMRFPETPPPFSSLLVAGEGGAVAVCLSQDPSPACLHGSPRSLVSRAPRTCHPGRGQTLLPFTLTVDPALLSPPFLGLPDTACHVSRTFGPIWESESGIFLV